MTDFTKGILKRELHTFAGILCGGAIANALTLKNKKGGHEFTATLLEIISSAAIGYYLLSSKNKFDSIRFFAGLLVCGYVNHRASHTLENRQE